jgi:hypothetical protein
MNFSDATKRLGWRRLRKMIKRTRPEEVTLCVTREKGVFLRYKKPSLWHTAKAIAIMTLAIILLVILTLSAGCAPRKIYIDRPEKPVKPVTMADSIEKPEPKQEPLHPSALILDRAKVDARQIACDIAANRLEDAFAGARELTVFLVRNIKELFPNREAGMNATIKNETPSLARDTELRMDDAFDELDAKIND